MRLFGKYTFDKLRDALQGVFSFEINNGICTITVWQLRAIITPFKQIELKINCGPNKDYKTIGIIQLQNIET